MNREAPKTVDNGKYPAIAAELLGMMQRDQEARSLGVDETKAGDIDASNTDRLKRIIEEIGWPTASKVGMKGANYAGIVAIHSRDIDFKKKYLEVLLRLKGSGELNDEDIAFITDKICAIEGKPQIYGTQKSWPIADEAKAEELRKELGMMSLAEYRKGPPEGSESWLSHIEKNKDK